MKLEVAVEISLAQLRLEHIFAPCPTRESAECWCEPWLSYCEATNVRMLSER
ncbi:hypothetical protein J6590_026951 [Homalodisca vitripennis]|nr:hypothetical protein J6590_026951 [Homalodisca vitripennis]